MSKANLSDLVTLQKGGEPQGDPVLRKERFVTFDKHIFKLGEH